MTLQTAKDSALRFLETLKENNLICWNQKYINEEYYTNYDKFEKDFENAMDKIALDTKNDQQLTKEEARQRIVFMIYARYSYVVSHLEILNKFLRILVCQKPRLTFDENTPLSNMITMICDKIGYGKNLQKAVKETFHVKFRNAVAHHSFLISANGITIHHNDVKNKKTYNLEQLDELSASVQGLLSGFLESAKNEAVLKGYKSKS